MSLLGMIPARGGSKRLRAKNVRKLCDKPLLAHTIDAAIESNIFDEIIVSTDDEEIAAIAEEYGASVPFERPEDYATDEAQVKDVARHAIEYYQQQGREFDSVMNLLPTSPLRSPTDIREAYEKFQQKDGEYLISVTDYRYTPMRAFVVDEDDRIEPYWLQDQIVDDRSELFARSQDHPDFLVDSASFYLVDTEAFLAENTFHGDGCLGYYIPPERAIDIDDKFDFKIAEFLLEEEMKREEGYDIMQQY